MTAEEIIYQDEFTVFGFKDNIPYITSVWDNIANRPAVAFNESINVHIGQTIGDTVYFSFRPPGTEGASFTLLYALRDGRNIIPFNIPGPLCWLVEGNYLYGVANSIGALNDINTNKAPYGGNLFRVNITMDYDKQEVEWLGEEGYHYGYEMLFTDTGKVDGVKDGKLTPHIEIKGDGIYAMGVELHAANAIDTYGYYKIATEGRSHTEQANLPNAGYEAYDVTFYRGYDANYSLVLLKPKDEDIAALKNIMLFLYDGNYYRRYR